MRNIFRHFQARSHTLGKKQITPPTSKNASQQPKRKTPRKSSSLTGRTIFNPRYQVFCQVGWGFVFFWFGLVWVGCGSKMGQKCPG
nr:MAG TPA: hypothetical protein [Caudoviricetes sp.]